MASRNTHVQLNSHVPLPSSPPHPRTPHPCLLDPSISNPKVTANSSHHQPNSWAFSQDILRRVGATCLSSHRKQVTGARGNPSTAQVHPCPDTCCSLWDRQLGKECLMSFLCGALCCCAPFGNLMLLSRRSLSQGKRPVLMISSSLRPSPCKPQLSSMTHDGRKIHSLGVQARPNPHCRCSSIV